MSISKILASFKSSSKVDSEEAEYDWVGQPQIQGAGGPQVQMTGGISLGNPQAVADSMRLAVGKG